MGKSLALCLSLAVLMGLGSLLGCGGGAGALFPAGGPPALGGASLSDALVSPDTFGVGRIIFQRAATGGPFLWVMKADGSGQTRLTDYFTNAPEWRPDGLKIAFVGKAGSALEIFAINPNGSGKTNLTNTTADNRDPAWSPDGTKIAFTSKRQGNPNLFVMNADGSGVRQLTSGPFSDFHPTWSPDGTKIAFSSNRSGSFNIFTIFAAGRGLGKLTNVTGTDSNTWPEWSPNPGAIMFMSKLAVNGDRLAIYSLNLATGTLNFVNWGTTPGWSPDFQQIVFAAGGNLFAMNANGTQVRRLFQTALSEGQPDWGL